LGLCGLKVGRSLDSFVIPLFLHAMSFISGYVYTKAWFKDALLLRIIGLAV